MIELTIPAEQTMMLVVRMTLSGFCASCGMGFDIIEDIRIAADEACWCLLNQPGKAERLRLTCSLVSERVDALFEAERGGVPAAGETHDPEIARGILETLARDVSISSDERGVYAIRLSLPRVPVSAGVL